MNEERDWAAFYRQQKDDPEMWGEPEEGTPPTRRRGLSATITVRFSHEEASEIRDLAKNLGVSYSDIVRRAVREFVHPRPLAMYRRAAQFEDENRTDFSLSNAGTSTGSPAFP